MIRQVTFTGIDALTDIGRVIALGKSYPGVEFGILFSRRMHSEDPRYMTFQEIQSALSKLAGKVDLALHVCGRAVGELVSGSPDILDLVCNGISRVQLNFKMSNVPFSLEQLEEFIEHSKVPVITQEFPANSDLKTVVMSSNHQILFDTSGGRGVLAERYQAPFPHKRTGYAGGIGPSNIVDVAKQVNEVSTTADVWIDMEERIRTDMYLDLDKCEAVLREVFG
jgi:phosphoribosylanthranilate isomerase